jgi:hypothetical protein
LIKERTITFSQWLVRLLVVPLTFGGLASAATIIVPTGVDNTRGMTVWLREDGTNTQAYAGVIFITLTDSGHQYNRDTLCVDLFTPISAGVSYSTTLLTPNQVPGKHLSRVSWLIDNVLLPAENSSYTSLLPQVDWVTTAAQGAGLQLAIWDIVHDNGDGFSAGRVRQANGGHTTNSQVLTWARTYETLSANKDSNLAYIYDNVILNGTTPAQMLAGPLFTDGGPAPPVPEPSTFALGAGALAAIGLCVLMKKGGPGFLRSR